jgi:hypothetical protein
MILQVPIKIKIQDTILELESLNRETGNTFGDYGIINADYVAKNENGLKSEFNIEFMDSKQFDAILKRAGGQVYHD